MHVHLTMMLGCCVCDAHHYQQLSTSGSWCGHTQHAAPVVACDAADRDGAAAVCLWSAWEGTKSHRDDGCRHPLCLGCIAVGKPQHASSLHLYLTTAFIILMLVPAQNLPGSGLVSALSGAPEWSRDELHMGLQPPQVKQRVIACICVLPVSETISPCVLPILLPQDRGASPSWQRVPPLHLKMKATATTPTLSYIGLNCHFYFK